MKKHLALLLVGAIILSFGGCVYDRGSKSPEPELEEVITEEIALKEFVVKYNEFSDSFCTSIAKIPDALNDGTTKNFMLFYDCIGVSLQMNEEYEITSVKVTNYYTEDNQLMNDSITATVEVATRVTYALGGDITKIPSVIKKNSVINNGYECRWYESGFDIIFLCTKIK